jgi:hypothetical protein
MEISVRPNRRVGTVMEQICMVPRFPKEENPKPENNAQTPSHGKQSVR